MAISNGSTKLFNIFRITRPYWSKGVNFLQYQSFWRQEDIPKLESNVFTCVDQAPATPEYKLLQLWQCLTGEVLRSIESFGHSTTAYLAAMERLEIKFGGERGQIAIY